LFTAGAMTEACGEDIHEAVEGLALLDDDTEPADGGFEGLGDSAYGTGDARAALGEAGRLRPRTRLQRRQAPNPTAGTRATHRPPQDPDGPGCRATLNTPTRSPNRQQGLRGGGGGGVGSMVTVGDLPVKVVVDIGVAVGQDCFHTSMARTFPARRQPRETLVRNPETRPRLRAIR
jgi:hypothetical protein